MPARTASAVNWTAEPLMSIEDLAEFLGIPTGTIHQWRHKGKGPKGFRVGRWVRFERSEVERWVREQAAEAQR